MDADELVDPSKTAPYPRGLALDLALETRPLPELLVVYDLTPAQAKQIFVSPVFRQEYEGLQEAMKEEGWSFRIKASAQAEAYLSTLWEMANSEATPAAVRADIIKSTVKYAGLDQPTPATPSAAFPELLDKLKTLPDGELELRIMQIVLRKGPEGPKTELGRLIEHDGE